jgi:hypothetical protein
MKIAEHIRKAECFEAALSRLDPLADGEIYAVFLMRAATNRLNAAMHALGETTDGAATDAKLGDLNHTYKPPLKTAVPAPLARSFVELAFIENLRPDIVRGPVDMDRATAERAKAAHALVRRETAAVLEKAARR